jgi:hypothetical protein
MTITAPAKRRSTSYSKITGETTIHIGYAELTEVMDMVFGVWDSLKLDATDERIGERFNDLVEHLDGLREWTGWGGVPGKLLAATP